MFLYPISVRTAVHPGHSQQKHWALAVHILILLVTASLLFYSPSSVLLQPVTLRVVLNLASPHKRLFEKLQPGTTFVLMHVIEAKVSKAVKPGKFSRPREREAQCSAHTPLQKKAHPDFLIRLAILASNSRPDKVPVTDTCLGPAQGFATA